MLISHPKKFIFVHNYKVAGTSMRKALRSYDSKSFIKAYNGQKLKILLGKYPWIFSDQFKGHVTAKELKKKLPKEIFEEYFKFGFVRNPWDWQVSLYKYMLKNTKHYQHELGKSFGSFENYLDWRVNKELRLQKNFFYDHNNTLLVDHVAKFENMPQEITYIAKTLGINIEMPHLNNNRVKEGYLQHYTQSTLDLVEEAFLPDIKAFAYAKPVLTT